MEALREADQTAFNRLHRTSVVVNLAQFAAVTVALDSARPMSDLPFWRRKRLEQMTREEWESLCDGCGKCCLHKLEDADTGEIAMTDVSCGYLDLQTCRCSDYANRQSNVPDCVKLTRTNLPTLRWLPGTCAYRLIYQGNDLPNGIILFAGIRKPFIARKNPSAARRSRKLKWRT